MWIKRDFEHFLDRLEARSIQPVKVLKGPRQVGKTSLLTQSTRYRLVPFDDLQVRLSAQENPRLFLDQFNEPILLDEATLAPQIFPELKRRVDEQKRRARKGKTPIDLDIWVTGSNQTLLEQSVQESLAGRATYFDLNTLSLNEIGRLELPQVMLRGGWPELHANSDLNAVQYLNDLIATFIERDIVLAAGIERKASFTKSIILLSSRIGQLLNASDIAKSVGADLTTVQSWTAKLQQNALIRILPPYFTNLNQRLIKTPKIYFEDIGLATRFQGWVEYEPLFLSSSFGALIENLALIEISRYFQNRGMNPKTFFLRSKEKVEIDFLIELPNNRWLAAEVKSTPTDFTKAQMDLLLNSGLSVVDCWVLTPLAEPCVLTNARVIPFMNIHQELSNLLVR